VPAPGADNPDTVKKVLRGLIRSFRGSIRTGRGHHFDQLSQKLERRYAEAGKNTFAATLGHQKEMSMSKVRTQIQILAQNKQSTPSLTRTIHRF
jgi:hypothetical protein